MERKHLLDKISDCLSSNGSQKDINKLCRDYLNENVQNKDVKDSYIKEILMSLANHFSVVLDYEVVNDKTYVNKNKSKNNKAYSLLGIAGVAGVTTVTSESSLVRIIACGMLAASSILATKYLCEDGRKESEHSSLKVKTSIDNISIQLQHYENIMNKLAVFNSLETYDREILSWIQQQYSESEDEQFKKHIQVVMKHCGYEFVDYSEEYADGFDSSAANIDATATTSPAIKSKHSGCIVQRGHVVFPKK